MMGNDDVSPTNGQPHSQGPFCTSRSRERALGTRLVNGGEKMGTKIFGWLIAIAEALQKYLLQPTSLLPSLSCGY